MNLEPPPETEDINELREWCKEVWHFLQFPHFELIRIVERSAEPTGDGAASGVIYYDSDDDKLKCHNSTAFQDTY